VLEELDRAEPLAGPQLLRRPGESLPLPRSVQLLEEQNLGATASRPLQSQPRRNDTRVVDDDELARQLLRELLEPVMPNAAALPLVDEEPRLVAALGRVLRDQLLR
jgi:hypothetical protein